MKKAVTKPNETLGLRLGNKRFTTQLPGLAMQLSCTEQV